MTNSTTHILSAVINNNVTTYSFISDGYDVDILLNDTALVSLDVAEARSFWTDLIASGFVPCEANVCVHCGSTFYTRDVAVTSYCSSACVSADVW